MAESSRTLGSAIWLTGGQGVTLVCRFVRNVIFARILSEADFGVAATFALTLTSLELVANLSIDRVIVQSKDGDDPEFQAVAHTVQIARGAFMAVMLAVIAFPIAYIFKVPETRWAFLALAIAPAIRCFQHFDINRFERSMRFGPRVMVEGGSQVLITIASAPLAFWLRDYTAMLWILLADAVIVVAGTHLFAERRYMIGFDRRVLRSIFHFAWPLLLNGLLMFFILQGDRYVVGGFYSVEALAGYALAVSLVMAVHGIPFRIVNQMMLPQLSSVQDDQEAFLYSYTRAAALLCAVTALFTVLVVGTTPVLVPLIYGERYEEAFRFAAWLSAAQAVRMIRVGPALACMARGDTKALLVANVVRAIGFAVVVAVAVMQMEVVWVARFAPVAELPALAVAIWWAATRQAVPLRAIFVPAVLTIFSTAGALILIQFMPVWPVVQVFAAVGAYAAVVAIVFFVASSPAREALLDQWAALRNRGSHGDA